MPRHAPEVIPGEGHADGLAGPGRRFYVYVLATDRGHYVGHTARPQGRLREHLKDQVRSTRGANPERIWLSDKMKTRREAQRMEATLKTWRDERSERFLTTTGVMPEPWRPEQ